MTGELIYWTSGFLVLGLFLWLIMTDRLTRHPKDDAPWCGLEAARLADDITVDIGLVVAAAERHVSPEEIRAGDGDCDCRRPHDQAELETWEMFGDGLRCPRCGNRMLNERCLAKINNPRICVCDEPDSVDLHSFDTGVVRRFCAECGGEV